MIELELLGTSSDGESLVLTDAQGERYSVLISDELRGATRRDRPKMDIAPSRPTLAPRDIQALLRAGATPEEIATKHGMGRCGGRTFRGSRAGREGLRALARTCGSYW